MAEEPSPASTSSTSGNHSENSSNGQDARVVILKQPPTHVFADEWFDIEVGLESLRGSPAPAARAELVATIQSAELDERVVVPSALTVDPESIRLSTVGSPSKRRQFFRCRINGVGLGQDKGPAFVIRISERNEGDTSLKAVTTRQIKVVRLKLDIKEKDGWESVWYKDEGGRDKCMTVTVGLYDNNNKLETGSKVPLQLTLCYDTSGEPMRVSRQEIFRMIGTTRNYIDKKSGAAVLRFRIEDVSKNHQGQDFRVEVAPDPKASGFQDVAPTYTPSVSIRSKRNKRQRGGPGKSEMRGPSPIGGRPPPPYPHARGASYPGDEQEGMVVSDVSHLREAMKGVITWTEDVVNGLYPLQWHVIGYGQNPDGSPDYNRPYHNMPNPNSTISRILSTYSEATRENLRVLLSAVEKSSPGSHAGSPFLPPGAPMSGDRFGVMEGPTPPMLPPPMDPRLPPMQPPFSGVGVSYQPVSGEAFRDKRDTEMTFGGPPGHGVAMRQAQQMFGMRPQGPGTLPMHQQEAQLPPPHLRQGKTTGLERDTLQVRETQRPQRPFEEESRENEVEYIIAKQFKALRTGERLGFPAYSANKELLGFYRESSMNAGVGQFVPISSHREDFGQVEIMQATQILEEAIATKSGPLYSLKDWGGNISSLVDHALVYDWSKEIGGNSNSG